MPPLHTSFAPLPLLEQCSADRVRERRVDRRYPLTTPVKYRIMLRDAPVSGQGWTVNVSSGGVLIETSDPPPEGLPIELSIAWPARLNVNVPLGLHIVGRTVRREGDRWAVTIEQHQFRTRAVASPSRLVHS